MATASPNRYRITRVVAERTLEFRAPGTSHRRVKVRLGQPRKAGPDWVCPYEILGMPTTKRWRVFGGDAFQALTLAFHILPVELDAMAGEPLNVFVNGTEVPLTAKEFELLTVLVRHEGKVVSREQLMRDVWDTAWYGSTKTLDMHISVLRRKLGDDVSNQRLITTVRGVGFRFDNQPG